MGMPRGIMVLRDRRDRILIQQQQGHGLHPGPGCPPLHPGHFNRPPNRFDGEDDEFARILPPPGAVVWDGHQQHQHQQQQQALAGVMLRRRMNPQHMQQHHLPPPPMLLPQQACQVQPQEWDGGPPHPSQVHEVMRRRSAGLVVDGEFLVGLRHREEMGDLRNSEHLKLASRVSHEKMIAESEYLRIASRASHEKLIERDHQLKNAYRASHEKIIAEKEYLKKVARPPPPSHASLGGKPMESEGRPLVADMSRPFHAPLQVLDPLPSRSHVGPFASWEENAHSDLVIRYGARQPPPPAPPPPPPPSSRSQELSADASIPPGFQSVIMSCKRPRDEDSDFDRPRLQQRPRRPLPLDSILHPLQRPKGEPDQQPQVLYGSSRSSVHADEDHEEGQVTPPQLAIPVYRAEPIGPPGFYKPELEAASRLLAPSSEEPASAIASSRGGSLPEAPSLGGPGAPPFQDVRDSLLMRPKSSSSKPSAASRAAAAAGGSDSGPPSRPSSSRGIALESGPASRPPARAGGLVDPAGQISRPSAAAARILVVESPSRRTLPPPPPPPPLPLPPPPLSSRVLSIIDSPTRRPSTARAVGIDRGPPSPTDSSRPSTARALGRDSGPASSSRPSSSVRAGDIDSFLGVSHSVRLGGPFKGEILIPKRERSSPTPLRKDSDQQQRLSSGGAEANASEGSNVRRKAGKDSEPRSSSSTRHAEARAMERAVERAERAERADRYYGYSERRKRPHRHHHYHDHHHDEEEVQDKDIRPYPSTRKSRIIPDPDGRPSKGSRWDDALKLKSARQAGSTAKEGREGREMTISVHKHGQRTVKVEDSSKSRASVSRSPIYIHSHHHCHERGGIRDGSESTNKDIERLSENRSKECDQLLLSSSLAGQDKGLGSQLSKEAGNSRHSSAKEAAIPRLSLGSSSSQQERQALLPPRQIKKEIIPLSDNAESEPPQRAPILSRLSTLKPPDSSLATKTRLRAEMLCQDKIVSQANSKALLPCASSSVAHTTQNVGGKVKSDRLVVVEGSERPLLSKQVASLGAVVEEKTLTTPTSLRTLSGKVGKVQATREELNSQLSARLLKLQIPDGSKGDSDEAVQTRYPSISISPNGIKNVYSPLQKVGPSDGSPRDSRNIMMHKADTLQLRLEGPGLSTADPLAPSPPVIATDASIEVTEQSPGCRPTPKLIFTGHKSDQSLKETSPQADISLKEFPGLVGPRISDSAKTSLEKSDSRKSIAPIVSKVSPADTARRVELTEARNRTSQYIVASDAGPASPQWNLLENKMRSFAKHSETLRKPSTGPSTLSMCLPSVQPVKSLREHAEHIEFSQAISLSTTDVSGVFENEEEVRHPSGVNHIRGHEEEKAELALVTPSAPPSVSAPKEVRLFGANLIAPVLERVESSSKTMDAVVKPVKPVEPEICTVLAVAAAAAEDVQPAVPSQQITESAAVPQDAAVVPAAEAVSCTGTTEQAVLANNLTETKEQSSLAHEDPQSADPIAPPDTSEVQAQSNEIPLQQEKQVVTVAPLPKGVSLIVRQQSSSRVAGAHTWLRCGGTSSATPASSVMGFRSTASGTGGVPQPAVVRGRGTQGAAYVRKGNSLVRAPGAVTLPSSAPPPGMLGQIRPTMVNQGPSQKPPIFRNTFFPTHDNVKSSQPALRKSAVPSSESAGAIAPLPRSLIVPSAGLSQVKNGSVSETGITSGRPKTPPQGALGVGSPMKTGFVLSASTLPQSGTGSRLQIPVGDDVGDNLAEASNTSPGSKTLPVVIPSNSVNLVPGPNNMVYVRRKANQLVVAPCPQSVDMSLAENQAVNKQLMPDLYIKRKTNQLVRNSGLKGNGNSSFVQALLGNGPPGDLTEEGSRNSILYKKMRLGRVLRQKKGLTGRSSWVWTLSGATVSHDLDTSSGHVRKPAPLLFPWKRHSLTTSIRSRRIRTLPEGKKGSLLFVMSERLRRVRPVQPVYTRSADGFSLHRSGVMSLGGGNLKWTKSLEKRAKLASEAATKAVAAAESRKREKKEAVVEAVVKAKSDRRVTRKAGKGAGERIVWVGLVRYKMDASSKTLQRIPDTKGESGTAISSGPTKTLPLLTPRRSYIGGTVYLRVGNGNQLVRDPKAASQALASEKVRWSLHHARSRGAKKQQYCQFFTRFGKCNKENGKCIYIHDPDKVAVCTKFLKGNCTDGQCLLTHKVIPERMPDCSFFLEGLCTNESCPYRHVNVNPKAPYCDGFLRGYCKDGEKCNKKHTYVCPTHAATGECSDQATCKFHHPKKKGKVEIAISRKLGLKRKRRYFCSTDSETGGKSVISENCAAASSVTEDDIPVKEEKVVGEDLVEFISLANTEEQDGETKVSPETQKPWSSFTRPGVPSFIRKEAVEEESGSAQEVERWIKPTFLFKVTSPAAS
ncbi:hypothetical protein Mapa_003494 [Marchantia paleacea]|nr:hypothetical protein Mapa_003494 [Marchantia paleacea]